MLPSVYLFSTPVDCTAEDIAELKSATNCIRVIEGQKEKYPKRYPQQAVHHLGVDEDPLKVKSDLADFLEQEAMKNSQGASHLGLGVLGKKLSLIDNIFIT